MKILLPQVAADEDDKEDRPPPGSSPSIVCGSRIEDRTLNSHPNH